MTARGAGPWEGPLPARMPPLLLAWYDGCARELPWRSRPTPYRVWVSEIMLQQTRVEAVKPYFLRFVEALPDAAALARCPEDTLMKLWEGLGYYSRARNLQKAARVVTEEYGGELPASYEALRRLPGVGDYTAGAIASIAFGLPCPAVDGNVLRVLARLCASRRDMAAPGAREAARTALLAVLPRRVGDFNQALMDLGACVCLPNGQPLCGECPLGGLCRAKALGLQGELPVKSPKKARRREELTVLLLRREGSGETALRRRPDRGLLAGLWELPNLPGTPGPEEVRARLAGWGLETVFLSPLPPARHIFTHVEWQMAGWEAVTAGAGDPAAGLVWLPPREILQSCALPTAFQSYRDRLEKGGQYDHR